MKTNRRSFLKAGALAGTSLLCAPIASAQDTKKKFKLPYKNTYIKNPYVTENEFRIAKPELLEVPSFESKKEYLPSPFWKGHDQEIKMYWEAWKIAFGNVRKPPAASGFITNYLDTAYNGNIFMWDSSFITMFAKYGSRAFPFQKTLDNFYAKQHVDGFICREIKGEDGMDCFHRYDPVSTGPNLLPWSEYEYFQMNGDIDRLHKVFPVLTAFNRWLKQNRTWRNGTYWSSGWGTGMDNQPRVPEGYNMIFSHGHMIWLDTCLQQIMVDNMLVEIGFHLERWQEIEDIEDERDFLKEYVRKNMWNNETKFLYDQYSDDTLSTMEGIGAFWALMADVLDEDQEEQLISHLTDEQTFNRKYVIPSLPANHDRYQDDGRYWQGGIWAPTNYMVIKGLQRKKQFDLAHQIAVRHLNQVFEVWQKTGTFWEYYAPEKCEPGLMARPDFIGWTGLPPIAVLIEAVFGINANYGRKEVLWNINLTEEHGINAFPFGTSGEIDFKVFDRKSPGDAPVLEVVSDHEFTLILNWQGKEKSFKIQKGENRLKC